MDKISTPTFCVTLMCFVLFLSTGNLYAKSGFNFKKIKEFIPEGYVVYDTASGDFNGDGFRDYAIVLKSVNENEQSNAERPLLLLTGTPKDKFELFARNDRVVLCANCGGMFGDPYEKVSINGQTVSVEHNIGGNWQWSRTITFKYDPKTNDVLLEEDVTKSYQKFSKNNQKKIPANKTDFGNLSFASYSYSKGFSQ